LDEQGPSYVKVHGQELLYFSSSAPIVPGDIYVSARGTDGTFGPASPVPALNSAVNDIQPNVRKDGREIVFSSNRGDSTGQDIWVSVRDHADDPWSPPTRLGIEVNTAAADTRPSLSGDGQRLYFGRAPGPEGMSDIYSPREKKRSKARTNDGRLTTDQPEGGRAGVARPPAFSLSTFEDQASTAGTNASVLNEMTTRRDGKASSTSRAPAIARCSRTSAGRSAPTSSRFPSRQASLRRGDIT
jgi:Tol biopolymer transport system component